MREGLRAWIACALLAGAPLLANDPPFEPPPNITGESAWIALRHQSQEPNLCVPASASMILDYFGDPVSPRVIKALTRKKDYVDGDPFYDFTATSFDDLVAGLARRGYRWREKSYAPDARGFDRGIADIERSLDRGIPVMIDTTLYHGHAYVAAGYSAGRRLLFVTDPAAKAPGNRAVRFADLLWIWNSRETGSARRWAVFPARGREGVVSSR